MIDLMPSAEQQEMIGWAAGLLDQELPSGHLLQHDLDSFEVAPLLRRLGALGWFGFTAPEAEGGAGLRVTDEALMFRELGRRLVPGPIIATTLAARLASAAGDAELAAALVAGTALAGLAEVRAEGQLVIWDAGGEVDYTVVVDERRPELWLVASAELPPHDAVDAIDPFHRLAIIDGAELPHAVLTAGDAATDLLAHARVLAAAYLTGLAEGSRDRSAAYAKERVQFGKPIGTFQAVKHRCADTALRAEAAWSQTAVAAIRLSDVGADAAELDVAAAKVVAGDAAIRNARDNIQNHGGIGYTAENEAHLFLKRSHVLANSLGDTRSFTTLLLEGTASW